MTAPAIAFRAVTRTYGRARALDALTLEVPRGCVLGLLGRNGAGKTTAIRLAMGLAHPSAGQVEVFGESAWNLPNRTKQRIGYVSETQKVFEWMSVRRAIHFHAGFYPGWDDGGRERLLGRFELDPRSRVSSLSLGNKKRLYLLLALCQRPDLLVLDEPASNLDTVVRRDVLDVLIDLLTDESVEPRTVLVSSHILTDLERVVDRVAILDAGRLAAEGTLEDLKADTKRLRVFAAAPPGGRPELHGARVLRWEQRENETLVTVAGYQGEATHAELARAVGTSTGDVEAFDLDLEDVFLAYVRRPADADA